jgi:ribosome-associated protein
VASRSAKIRLVVSEIPIRGDTIRLGQLLKLAGVVDSGSDVKALLASEPAWVNGERETRRGRQLREGDTVRVGEHRLRVIGAPDSGSRGGVS